MKTLCKAKNLLIGILCMLVLIAVCIGQNAIAYEKSFRGNVIFHGMLVIDHTSNMTYWTGTSGVIDADFDTQTDTASWLNLDLNYTDDTGSENAYGMYINIDDNSTAASTLSAIFRPNSSA